MARRGRFGTGGQGGSVAGSVIKNILQMQGTGTEEAPPAKTPREKTPVAPLTQEQIAKNAVLSGRLSYDQSRINMIKYMRAVNKMPLATETGKGYNKKLAAAQKALAKFGPNPSQIEQNFYALGGKLNKVDGTGGYGWSAKQVLNYWRDAGMEEKGREIVSKLRGYDQYGNDIEGGIDTSKNLNFSYGPEMQIKMQSGVKGLNALQAAKITKLRNLKQAGTTLTPRQQAALKRLRALKKG